ncbi:hypothetical protein D039_0865A, partial [Vibrio parahaemolyticus EKP-028]
MIKKVTA